QAKKRTEPVFKYADNFGQGSSSRLPSTKAHEYESSIEAATDNMLLGKRGFDLAALGLKNSTVGFIFLHLCTKIQIHDRPTGE
ncbi:MAG TPA: hypothetical protein PKK99_15645, partial [Bacteroidia bacterium]|nr:hypothetical protein [Bacteroidia bacterium]